MKATVIVKLKEGVLDPQGETIRRALTKLGYPVQSVRQGKYFELELSGDAADAASLERISQDVLSNPIVETFQIGEGGQKPPAAGASAPARRKS